MRTHPCFIPAVLMLGLVVSATALAARPLRTVAEDLIVVAESKQPKEVSLYTPSIISLKTGRLIACYTETNRILKEGRTLIVTSDDHGKTWVQRAESPTNQGRLFMAGEVAYYIATAFYTAPGQNPNGRGMTIQRSNDDGLSWTAPVTLRDGTWHQTAANVWTANDNVYLIMERDAGERIASWKVGALAPVLMRGKIADDLTKPEAWTYASELVFQDVIPGYRENQLSIDFFGIPFFAQDYPRAAPLAGRINFPPIGWLEGNVVQIVDPNHYWFDPKGKTFHLFLRAHTGMTNYAALAKVVENDDGSMTTQLESAPSGKRLLFLPFPGGHMRFHVEYDHKSKLYWLLGSQSTDSMTRVDRLPDERYGRPDNERHRMVLHYSTNMVDWCFAGVVAIGPSAKQARHYASMAIDGDDLVVLSRSADQRAPNAHDGNLITFHRIAGFRDLVY